MTPTVKITIEVPIHYLEELQQIFEHAERIYLGSFRGVVASRVSETFKQLLEKKKEYETAATAGQLGQCVSDDGSSDIHTK